VLRLDSRLRPVLVSITASGLQDFDLIASLSRTVNSLER
jgi:hypothetical protein